MEKRIEKLSVEEGKRIYDERLVMDFPACEVKPWEKIERFVKEGLYEMFGMWENGVLLAYAFVAMDESKKHFLMDYFAISKEFRGRGYGQYFLKHFWELYPEVAGVIFEVEDAEETTDAAEKELRERRIRFYERAGLKMYPVCAKVYEACYQVMYFSNGENQPKTEWIVESYKAIYRVLIGEEKMKMHMIVLKNGKLC